MNVVWKYRSIKTVLWTIGASIVVVNSAVAAPTLQDQVDELEQKLDVLQRQMEIKDEASDAKSKDAGTVKAGFDSKGFVLKTGDGNNEFRVNGFIQADGRWYPGATPNRANVANGYANKQTAEIGTFTIRRARLAFTGTVGKYYSYYLQPSFDGGGAGLQDAWVNAGFKPYFNLRFGKFKLPFGLERLQAAANNSLVESGFTTWLTPNYDLGVQVLGTINGGPSALDYQLAITNGASQENQSNDSDQNGNKAWTIRLFDMPLKNSSVDALKGLGVGVAYSKSGLPENTTAVATGSTSNSVGTTGTVTGVQPAVPNYNNLVPGFGAYVTYTNALLKPGSDIKRFSPQGYWYYGPFGVLTEYVSTVKTLYTTGETVAGAQDVKNSAWQVVGTWVVTGENATYNNGVTPKKPFLKDGGTGAIELVARYQVLNIDSKNFTNDTGTTTNAVLSRATSISQAKGIGVSVNWYLSKNVKFQTSFDKFSYTDGGGGTVAAPLDRKADKTLFTRAEIMF